jgi:hypothetical protein
LAHKWYEVIGEQTIADAILDRIIHDAHRMELKGDAMRKKRSNLEMDNEEKENKIINKINRKKSNFFDAKTRVTLAGQFASE